MIYEVTMYSLKCDNCGKQYYDDNSGFTAMNDEGAIDEMAQNDDWYSDREVHYCPNCFEIDDDDKLVIKKLHNEQTVQVSDAKLKD